MFDDDPELVALREKQKRLEEAHDEVVKLPARLEKEKRERESTMPPMAEIREREQIKRFERSLSRGQIENTLRIQRQSLAMLLLLATPLKTKSADQIQTRRHRHM